MIKPAVFLDRDGVINIDKGYVYQINNFEWVEEAKDAIKFLKDRGYYVFVATNQSGIARGYYDEKDVEELHSYINIELKKNNTCIDDFFYSIYHPEGIRYNNEELAYFRKPNIGMLEQAHEKWQFDKSHSFLVGDKDTDIECAKRFGIKGYLFEKGSLLKFIRELK
ncbi:MAG: D-glycero-alpha-D-manno-heptose-1,7-bisphosphate 7-phosphatase [Candidatus Pelagibacterales bacterium]